jgi:hypothetical protein
MRLCAGGANGVRGASFVLNFRSHVFSAFFFFSSDEVLEAQQHAGAVMGRCLQRLGHIFVAAAVAKWADTVQQARRAAADAAHAQALADLEAASKLSLLDSQALRAQIELQKQEKAGRVVRYCLNRITSLACVEAWDRWLEVHQAMARAGRVMDRVLCRFASAQLVVGWEHWMAVLEAQHHAGVMMERCMGRILNAAVASAMSKWAEVIDYEKQASILSEFDALRARVERERQEKAGRLMQYTLNKILNARYVQAWDKWEAVNKAMERAGKVMHRVMVRFTSTQLVSGWERWIEVLDAQQHAGAVMGRCLQRLGHIFVAAALSKWADTVQQRTNDVVELDRPPSGLGGEHYVRVSVFRGLVHIAQKVVHRSFATWRQHCILLTKRSLLDELGRLRQDHKQRRRLQREAYRAGLSTNEQTHSQQLEAARAIEKVGKGATEAVRIELQRCQQHHAAALTAQTYEHTMATNDLLQRISTLTSSHDIAMREKDAEWGVVVQETAKQSIGMHGRMQSPQRPSSPQLDVASSLPPAMAIDKLLGLLGRFSPRNKIRIIDLFNALDQDRSGSVSRAELEAGLRRFGAQGLGDHEVEEIVGALDTDGDGEIDLRELRVGLRAAARGQPRGFGR